MSTQLKTPWVRFESLLLGRSTRAASLIDTAKPKSSTEHSTTERFAESQARSAGHCLSPCLIH